MRCLIRYRRSTAAALRLAVALMLAAALLAPKVSLATSLLFGEGYRTVVICSGAELVRITIGPDGETVSDVTEAWIAPDCMLTVQGDSTLARTWRLTDYPTLAPSVRAPDTPLIPLPRLFGPAVYSRGPPLV